MRRLVGAIVAIGFGIVAVGLLVEWIVRHRMNQDRVYCTDNLRQLAQFTDQRAKPDGVKPSMETMAIPAGTVLNPALPPDQRLSWVVELLPTFDQRRQETSTLLVQFDRQQAWDGPANAKPSRTILPTLNCYGNTVRAPNGEPAFTQYVGSGGVGENAPNAVGVPFPFAPGGGGPVVYPLGSGCFHYNSPTPFLAIADGLSETILFAEISTNVGPWIRGGPSTIRTLDPRPEALAPLGVGGQFGGNHANGANFGFADYSVRFLTDRIEPNVLRRLFTIAGDGSEVPSD